MQRNLLLMKYLVYALIDPRNGNVRYIGKSSCGLRRPGQHAGRKHLERDPNKHKKHWIKQLINAGLKYSVAILYQSDVHAGLNEAEIFWIAEGRRRDWPLVNISEGGEGCRIFGRKHTPESKAKIGVASSRPKPPKEQERLRNLRKGVPNTPEAKAKYRLTVKGRKRPPFSEVWKRHMSESKKGKKLSPEHIEKLRKTNTGKIKTQETIEKMKKGMSKVLDRIDPITGEVKEYLGTPRAIEEFKGDLSAPGISRATSTGRLYKGYFWAYPNGKTRGLGAQESTNATISE